MTNSACINHCDPGPDPALARAGRSGLAAFLPARALVVAHVLLVSAAHAELAWLAACDPDAVPVLVMLACELPAEGAGQPADAVWDFGYFAA